MGRSCIRRGQRMGEMGQAGSVHQRGNHEHCQIDKNCKDSEVVYQRMEETSDKKQKFKRRGLCSVFTYKGTQNIDKFNTRSPPQVVSVHKQENTGH